MIFRMKLSHRDQLEMLGRNPGLSTEGMPRVNKSEGTDTGEQDSCLWYLYSAKECLYALRHGYTERASLLEAIRLFSS